MKKLLLVLTIVLISNLIIGQTIVDTTKCWNTIIQGPPYNSWPTVSTESIKIGQDTIIDLKVYRKLMRSCDANNINWDEYCFIRETAEKEIFVRCDTSLQEYLLYDFGAEVDDTVYVVGIESFMDSWAFFTGSVVVDSIDSVYFAGETRKRIILEGDQWIEGVGSLTGILHNQFFMIGGNWFELVCYSENEIEKYHNPDYSSCSNFTTGISELTKSENITVFPNPVSDKSILRITESTNGDCWIEIFDNKGSKQVSENFKNEFEINRKNFSKGLYLYRVTSSGKIIGAGKLVIE